MGICANSIGIIDNSYCGDDDQWHFSALCIDTSKSSLIINGINVVTINKGERICQFRIIENMPKVKFEVVEKLEDESRGGLGSTGGYIND